MADTREAKSKKLTEIKSLISEFSEKYLNDEHQQYCHNLAEAVARKRRIDILRSKSQQWAASIVYAIARVNFLFDKKHEFHVTADEICDFFGTNKSTTGNKATQIEKACNVNYGDEYYCSKDIREMFTFYVTEEGFIIPKMIVDREMERHQPKFNIGIHEEHLKALNEPELSIEEKRQREKERHLAELREKKTRRRTDENQLGLFDN